MQDMGSGLGRRPARITGTLPQRKDTKIFRPSWVWRLCPPLRRKWVAGQIPSRKQVASVQLRFNLMAKLIM